MIRPVDADISQRFGDNPTRNLPADSWLIRTFGNYQPDGHSGEDYACQVGTPVRAVTDGTVLHIGWMGGTYADNPWWVAPGFAGYCAVIDHGSFVGIYGHGQDGSARVAKGDRVSEGQVFILSGNTGGSTGPHLHFEILPDGWVLNSAFYGRIDPEPLFTTTIQAQSVTITPQEDNMPSVSDLLYAPIPKYDVDGNEVGTTSLAEVTAWNEANFTRQRRLTVDAVKETVLGVLTSPVPDVATGSTTNLATEVSWLPANFKRDAAGGVDVNKLAESIAAAVVNLSASAEKENSK